MAMADSDAQPAPPGETSPDAVSATPAVTNEAPSATGEQPGQAAAGEGTAAGQPTSQKPAEAPPPRTAAEFAKLARESRRIREERAALDRDRADLEAFRKLRETAATDPAAALKLAGLDLDTVARSYQPPDPAAEAKAKLDELQRRVDAADQARAEAERNALLESGKAKVASMVEAAADNFPLTHEMGKGGEVFDLWAEMLARGDEVTFEEAAGHVEKALENEEKAVLRAQQRRAKAKGGGAAGEPQVRSEEAGAKPNAHQSPTITSRMNGEAPTPAAKPFDLERHRREVMEAAVRGDLR